MDQASTTGSCGPARPAIQALLDQQIKGRFPDGSIDRVELLRYGDDPSIEPGKLLVRVNVRRQPSPATTTT